MNRLRIALAHPYSWPQVRRGAERYLADLAAYLVGSGHEVEVLTGIEGESVTERLDDGVVVRRLRHLRPGPFRRRGMGPVETFGAVALRHLLRDRYDVVHALTPTAALAGRLTRHPTLYTVLGQPDRAHFVHHPVERRVTAAAVRLSTEVAALSEAAASTEHAVFGRRPIVLSPGVRVDTFAVDARARKGPPRILFPADASDRRKQVDLAIAALVEVRATHADARLALGGPGDHGWALERLDAETAAGVADAIDVLGVGALEEVPDRYRSATVTLLPSVGEAFGLGIVESLACGTPTVCLAGGGPEEIVRDHDVGVVATAPTPAAVAEALLRAIDLAGDETTPARCAAHARRWDWSQEVGPAHEEVYRRVARSTSAGRSDRGRPR